MGTCETNFIRRVTNGIYGGNNISDHFTWW